MSGALSLTERARSGEPDAIAELLQLSEPDLRRFASRVCRSAADADDAVQHAMITLTLRLDTFRGLSRLSTWVFTVIRNECRRYERLARRWVLGAEGDPEDLHTPERAFDDAQTLQRLVRAIRELPPDLRDVFVLRDLEESSSAECAARLSISEANVKVRLHRARNRLREALTHEPR